MPTGKQKATCEKYEAGQYGKYFKPHESRISTK